MPWILPSNIIWHAYRLIAEAQFSANGYHSYVLHMLLGKSNFSDNLKYMNPVSVVEVHTTKFSQRLFLLKI